jgi:hypothetical protein
MISRNRSNGRAGVRGLSLTIVALLALAIVGVSSASATPPELFTMPSTNPTVQRNWGTGPQPGRKLAGTRTVTMSLASEKLTYETTLGGSLIAWSAAGLECANCKIENRAGTGENTGNTEAVFSGQIKLSGVKSIAPAGCVMPSTLTLQPTTGVVGGEKGSSTKVTFRLSPTSGTTWASYELTGCSVAGTYKWTGNAYGEFVNALGVDAKTQKLRLSPAIQTNLQRPNKPWFEPQLKFGENQASFTGEINISAEEEFQVSEKPPVIEGNSFTTPSTNPTIPRNWYTGAQPGTKLVGAQATQMSLASEKLTFETTIAGLATKFTSSSLECANCKIENRAGTGENKSNTEAVFSGELSLGGLNMVSPAGCSIMPSVKTKPMTGVVGGEKGSPTTAAFRLSPTSGTTWAIVEIAGVSCPIAGLYKVNGNEFGAFANPLGVDAKTQRFSLTQTIQEVLGTPTSLKFGENPVIVNGEVNIPSAVEYQVKEK